jgi:hypothetical protein
VIIFFRPYLSASQMRGPPRYSLLARNGFTRG